jgi:hypothetical protein
MKSSRMIAGLTAALTLAVACATTKTAGLRGASCPLTQQDSAFLGRGPVYRDCAVDKKARLVQQTARVDYRPTRPGNGCYSADVELVVDTLGKPEISTVRVIRANDRGFADAMVASVPGWQFEPATIAGQRVRQIVNEHQAMGTVVVAVPAGSAPPPSGSRMVRPPSC